MGDRRQARDAVPSVAIFGCGRIGSALDEGKPEHVLSHAAACVQAAGVTLRALCDPDPKRLAEAGRQRGVSALYRDPEALLAAEAIDIAVIATPSALRTPLISQALSAGVRTFVIEKPLATDLAEASALVTLLESYEARVALNFLRRHASGLIAIKRRLDQGEFGEPQSATLHYGKGLNNNGSHGIDLMRWWLGEPLSVQVLGRVSDGRDEDPTLDLRFEVQGESGHPVPVTFIGSDHRQLSLFEFDLLCTKGRIRVHDRGAKISTSRLTQDSAFVGYSALGEESTSEGGLHHAVAGLWEDLLAVLRGEREAPRCGLSDGLAALQIVERTRSADAEVPPSSQKSLSGR